MTEIQQLETDIAEKITKLRELRKNAAMVEVQNYEFKTLDGTVSLLDLFAGKEKLFAIHNMGQSCRHCTIWADGLNAFVPHLESQFAVALVSKDAPELQRAFANSRGWRFRMASHGGGDYIRDQSVCDGQDNYPGMVCYVRKDDKIFKMNAATFGPGDLYCSIWHVLGLAGHSEADWTPQFTYWQQPKKLADGGLNVLEA